MSITGKSQTESPTFDTVEEMLEEVNSSREVEVMDEEVEMVQEVYHMSRWIAKGGGADLPSMNIWSLETVNKQINAKLQEGFEIFNTHYLGDVPEATGLLYVLVRWTEKK